MGRPMAGHLVSAGHATLVWNRTAGKAEGIGAQIASDLGEVGAECSTIFLCVNRTEDVEECLEAMLPTAKAGTLFVDHSTISPTGAKGIHEDLTDRGFRFIDAPITGGSMGAEKGQLTIFCGGEGRDIEAAGAFMSAYAKRFERVGGPGAGQMMKMANQIAVGGALMALCESMAFASRAGLDLAQTRELLMGGAAGSWAFENYGPKILNSDWSPGFSIKNQRKDFEYCFEAAEEVDCELPGTEVVDYLLGLLEERGRGEEATVALYELMREAGIQGA